MYSECLRLFSVHQENKACYGVLWVNQNMTMEMQIKITIFAHITNFVKCITRKIEIKKTCSKLKFLSDGIYITN